MGQLIPQFIHYYFSRSLSSFYHFLLPLLDLCLQALVQIEPFLKQVFLVILLAIASIYLSSIALVLIF